jgi:carbamate kinase
MMSPKCEHAIRFVESGRKAIITVLEFTSKIVKGKIATAIINRHKYCVKLTL